MTTYRIIGPSFTSKLTVSGDTVISADDLLDWSIGREWLWLLHYCDRKRWVVQPVIPESARVHEIEYDGHVYEFHWNQNRLLRITKHYEGGEEDVAVSELPETIQNLIE